MVLFIQARGMMTVKKERSMPTKRQHDNANM